MTFFSAYGHPGQRPIGRIFTRQGGRITRVHGTFSVCCADL